MLQSMGSQSQTRLSDRTTPTQQTLSVCGGLTGPVFSLSTGLLSGPMETVVSICWAPPPPSPGPVACSIFGKESMTEAGKCCWEIMVGVGRMEG